MTHEASSTQIDLTGGLIWLFRVATDTRQDLLAERIGVSKSLLSHIEAGRRPISAAVNEAMTPILNNFFANQYSGQYLPQNELQSNAAILISMHGKLAELKARALITGTHVGALLLKGARLVENDMMTDPVYHYLQLEHWHETGQDLPEQTEE